MKTILFILLSITCYAQVDTLNADLYMVPKGTSIIKEPSRVLMKLKMGKIYDHIMMGGLQHWYLAESNVDSLNQIGDKIRVLSIQVPYSFSYTAAQKAQLENLINSFNAQIPVVIKDTVDSQNLVYENWARSGVTTATGWYKGTISYSTTGEAKYTCEQCTGFEIWGEKGANHGKGMIEAGDQSTIADWTSTSTSLPAKVAELVGLQRGNHTISIKPTIGDVTIDFLIVHK